MDMWTDPNVSPFMGVTAHWIESQTVREISGNHQIISLQVALIGFIRVPIRHTGEHLAKAFSYVVDRLNIRNVSDFF